MDPVTAVAIAFGHAMEAYAEFLRGASPEQRQQIVQMFIDDQKFWRGLFDRLTPKAKP